MNCSVIRNKHPYKVFSIILALMLLVFPMLSAYGESEEPDEILTMDDIYVYLDGDDGLGELVPLHTVT